jgi:hypothetical protein
MVPVMTPLPVDEVWRTLMGPQGLIAKGSLAGLREGDRYSIETAAGERLAGVISLLDESKGFIATVESLNNALIGFSITAGQALCEGGKELSKVTFANWGALLFDMSPERAEEIKGQWAGLVQKTLSA